MIKKILPPSVGFVIVFFLHAFYSTWKDIKLSNQWFQIENTGLLSLYFKRQDYLLGFAYAFAGAFTIYAFLKFLQNRRMGASGLLGGVTLTGILYFGGCFLLGCCGSPMLAVYLGLFGSSFLGFTKPLVLILTIISVVIGFVCMEKKTKTSTNCCAENEESKETATSEGPVQKIQSELRKGMSFKKCKKCGCMKETLETLRSSLPSLQIADSSELVKNIEYWSKQVEPIKYSCLGCGYCFPAVVMNTFNQAFPEAAETQPLSCAFEVKEQSWPAVPGEYFAFCDGQNCPVAVSTLASVELARALAEKRPKELCIVGKTETENIGIDKIIKNTVTNPAIRFLLLAGKEPNGHHSGRTLTALLENGVDEHMRVTGSTGKNPVLRNVTLEEVESFRKQVQVVDMIGCEDTEKIISKIKELSLVPNSSCSCDVFRSQNKKPVQISTVPVIQAEKPAKIELDKAGYFVIIPQPEKKIITIEHYSNDNRLLRIIEGRDARNIYLTIIENGWVMHFSHAAYLGKELTKAELSIKMGFEYVQDGA